MTEFGAIFGNVCLFLGVALILFCGQVGRMGVRLYKKIGVEVPEDTYAKQVRWVGIAFIILGAAIIFSALTPR